MCAAVLPQMHLRRIFIPAKMSEYHLSIRRYFYFLLFGAAFVYMSCLLLKESDENIPHLIALPIIKGNSSVSQYPACPIPQLDPWDKSIQHLLNEPPPVMDCENAHPLLFNSTLDSTIVPVKDPDYYRKSGIDSCYYRTVTRSMESRSPDDKTKQSSELYPISLTHTTVIPPEHEFISIYCDGRMNDVHAFVPLKEHKEKVESTRSKLGEKKKWNVVIFGLDADSRMNFLRTMPNTFAYLKNELGAVEMFGYNKVADNTLPNIMPMLTGYKPSELSCTWSWSNSLNGCPFIWKEYSKQGYHTSYAEDAPDICMFNHGKDGFKEQPTDYYPRPIILLAKSRISSHRQIVSPLCYGPRLSFQILVDYMKKFVHRMSDSKRSFFQFIWSVALTHENLKGGLLGDQYLLDFLQWIKQSGYLNNTIFILMSDHGSRLETIRNTVQGALEDRLPFMYLVLPDDFKKQYKLAYNNLLNNSDKLVTTFDLHETLKDILDPKNIEDSSVAQNSSWSKIFSLPRGISLFRPIPEYRTCRMAGVEVNFCSCNFLKLASTKDPQLKDVGAAAITHINFLLRRSVSCSELQLEKIILAQYARRGDTVLEMYLINFQTQPGGAQFEALVSREKDSSWQVEGTVARTNLYGNQSRCVSHDVTLKLYCYCVGI